MMVNVAINGFGRIGRMFFRAAFNDKRVNIVAINDPTDTKHLVYLLKHDSSYGIFNKKITAGLNFIKVGNQKIMLSKERDPEKLPWKKHKIDVVLESSGFFRTKELANKHIIAGAKKVLISANYKGNNIIPTLIKGVNTSAYKKNTNHIISKGSCTTTCLSPIVKVLDDNLGIKTGLMTTVHSITTSQRVQDSPHKIFREGRSLLNNIIPTETGAAIAVTRVIPKLKGKIDGMAMRVPTLTGSVVDFTCTVNKKTTVEKVNQLFKQAAKSKMKGIIQYSEEELVLSDIVGNTHSAIFDAKLTKVIGNTVKVIAWYDNEWGYCCRLVDMVKII